MYRLLPQAPEIKVFCFFSSEKKILPFFQHLSHGPDAPGVFGMAG
jgi:hypothetical protein